MNNVGFSPLLPLTTNQIHYDMIYDIIVNIHQNLKNLLLTNPGERIMIPDFGVGVRKYLFEIHVEEAFSDISTEIQEQVNTFMPFVEIDDIILLDDEENFDSATAQISLAIQYSIPSLGVESQITINS